MTTPKKFIRDRKNLSPEQKRQEQEEQIRSGPKGLYGHFMFEPVPDYAKAGSEVVVQGNNNSFIVLGRDRAGNPADGIGGMGGTGCGMIDMIVGLDGVHSQKDYITENEVDPEAYGEWEEETENRTSYFTSPNFVKDSARLYLTQLGDIDYYFGIVKGGENTIADTKFKSGAALKSDHTRIIGRRSVKIVTGKAKLQGADMHGEENSQGGKDDFPGQIDFIAGNYTGEVTETLIGAAIGDVLRIVGKKPPEKLQPLVRGQNLEALFRELFRNILDLANRVTENSRNLDILASSFQGHFHVAAGLGTPTSPSDAMGFIKSMTARIRGIANESMTKVVKHNLKILETNYLELEGPYNIKSKYVNTT